MKHSWMKTVPQPKEIYQHYKGDFYEVICLARLSEQRDVVHVVYQSASLGHIWSRPLTMWNEYVEWPDGSFKPRFFLKTYNIKEYRDE